jgi:molybdopterin/thiamine biosynthesis adenylyltransferase
MRRRITDHPTAIDATNVDQLQAMSFVFLCLDNGTAKRLSVDRLKESGKSFIDVGMGVELMNNTCLEPFG